MRASIESALLSISTIVIIGASEIPTSSPTAWCLMKISTLILGLTLACSALFAQAGDKPAPIELPAIHITAPAPDPTEALQANDAELAADQAVEQPAPDGKASKPIIY